MVQIGVGLTVKYKIKTRDQMQNVPDRTNENEIKFQAFFGSFYAEYNITAENSI